MTSLSKPRTGNPTFLIAENVKNAESNMNNDLEKVLREMGNQDIPYPPELINATKERYKQSIRRKGCPILILNFLVILFLAYLPSL